MYNLIFSTSIGSKTKSRILNIFDKYYNPIKKFIFLSNESVEIFFHKSDNSILDGEANMLQRFLIFHLSDNFSDDEFILLLAHELFHLSHYEFFGSSADNVGTIIDEGLAVLLEEEVREKFCLNVKTHPDLWRKIMSVQEKNKILKLAIDDNKIFYENWLTLHNNIDLKDENFADRVIYQVGYWLIETVAKRTNKRFEDLFFESRDFWSHQIKEILK